MARSRFSLLLAIVAPLLAACGDQAPPLPLEPEAPPLVALGADATEIGGDWMWSREEILTFPAWVAGAIFGIEPEGPTTTARCQGAGTMSLSQTDDTFDGMMVQTAHECVTSGGQVFQDPAAFAPVAVTDGQIRGRSLHFMLDGPLVDCPYSGVIAGVENGVATALSGRGRCILPGHPASDVPMDPPPAGTSVTLSWTAERP